MYRGVSWNKRDKKWQVSIRVDGKSKSLGYFFDEIAAARAYDAFVIAKKLNKPLNFPGDPAAKGHRNFEKTSGFRGVSWNKTLKKWRTVIKLKDVGTFTDEIEAARAYDAYAITYGINTPRNFPFEDEGKLLAEAKRVQQRNRGSSQYQGVSWRARDGKWVARVMVDYKDTNLGMYTDERVAAAAYDVYVRRSSGGKVEGPNLPDELTEDLQDLVGAYNADAHAAKEAKKEANRQRRRRSRPRPGPRSGGSTWSSRGSTRRSSRPPKLRVRRRDTYISFDCYEHVLFFTHKYIYLLCTPSSFSRIL